MSGEPCPHWEYKDHAFSHVLAPRSVQLLMHLRAGKLPANNVIADNRPQHGHLFAELTPIECPYFAGHWRGEVFRCLRYCNVGIEADDAVGAPAEFVSAEIDIFVKNALKLLEGIDAADKAPSVLISDEQKLSYLVAFSCSVFVEFLRIHPFANGNGHLARLIIWSLLARFGYWPKKWPLNNRPPDPPYSTLIRNYRIGHREELELFVLKCIIGDA